MNLIPVVFALGLYPAPGQNIERDISSIRATFKAYVTTLREKRGSAAAQLVDERTLNYYRRMRDMALNGSESIMRKLPIMDRIIVLRTRHQVPVIQLQRMNAAQFFAHGVKMDWMDSARASTLSPGIIEVNGRQATVYVLQNGKPSPVTFRFRKEGIADWRLDLTFFFAMGNAAFKTMIPKGQDENEFILDLLKTVSGRAPSSTIWQPLIPPGR